MIIDLTKQVDDIDRAIAIGERRCMGFMLSRRLILALLGIQPNLCWRIDYDFDMDCFKVAIYHNSFRQVSELGPLPYFDVNCITDECGNIRPDFANINV